ncbi:hypothetical protein BN871_FY_00250 [Paenibacillus sp. P22]|nr:hypothetical protein BN871_FY_00250 [Paenibacillus sp. P22]
MPNAARPPAGCRFHPRCPHAIDLCSQEEPQLRPVGASEAACHLAEQTMAGWQERMAAIRAARDS